MDAITRYLGVGSYAQWDEETRQSWLLTELQGKRPLLPRNAELSELGFDEIVQVSVIGFSREREGDGGLADREGAYRNSMRHRTPGLACF